MAEQGKKMPLIIKNVAGGGTNLMTTSTTNLDIDLYKFLNNATYPVGSIMPYHGDIKKILPNWKLCDGHNGTPNLNDKFIMGVNQPNDKNTTGGYKDPSIKNHSHNITIGSADKHRHTFDEQKVTTSWNDGHTHTQWNSPHWGRPRGVCNTCGHYPTGNPRLKYGSDEAWTWGGPGDHTHNFDIPKTSTGNAGKHNHSEITVTDGVSGSKKNLPAYIKTYFIMKVSK